MHLEPGYCFDKPLLATGPCKLVSETGLHRIVSSCGHTHGVFVKSRQKQQQTTNNKQPTNNNQQTTTTLRGHFGLRPGLSQWLPPSHHRLRQFFFGRWAPTPCRRGFACPYLRRGHSPEEVAAESEVERDHLLPCRDNAAPADGLMERVLQLERIVEQIVGVTMPKIMKGDISEFKSL